MFFKRVAKAVSCNPFSEERLEIDREIAGVGAEVGRPDVLKEAERRVSNALQKLTRREGGIGAYAEEDRALILTAVMFEIFHRYAPRFDGLIRKQVATGDLSCRADFVEEVLAAMEAYGFDRAAALHFVSKFYQLRRAFHLIYFAAFGRSSCMRNLRCRLWTNIFTHDISLYDRHMWNRMEDFSTLLLGETGTGKGMAALAIGRSGFIPYDPKTKSFEPSFMKAFVAINLSQYPEALIESELFGHRKGAFTGAIEEHTGVFARCSPHGAIFLDEIGAVGESIQIKLLQVLQERMFTPVGSHEQKRFHGRVIAATNEDLVALRRDGRFRDDFYYRLCSDQITVPPLRDRLREEPEELGDLVESILKRTCGSEAEQLKARVLEALERSPGPGYAWPGNVRELEQATRRILLKGSYEPAPAVSARTKEEEFARAVREGLLDANALLSGYAKLLYARHGTYGEVARRTGLNWRTVKKHVERADGF